MMTSTKDHPPTDELVKVSRIPHWRMVFDQAALTSEIASFEYKGSGTAEDPYLVQWIPKDPRNPMQFSTAQKWFITMTVAFATLAVTLVSSAYTGGVAHVIEEFQISEEVATLGVSLFMLGFAVGPLLWAPLSELFGRQVIFTITYAALTAFNAASAGARNPWTLMIVRFLAGTFGSSPLTNAGGVIADMFPASQRGLATAAFAAAPFLGPVLGPIIGGFLDMAEGWRWVMGFLAIFSGFVWILTSLVVPETYAPVLLRRRAAKMSEMTGKKYVSLTDHKKGKVTLGEAMKTALLRPWVLLFREPIVLLLSIYVAIIYGTLYMFFAAFPIVYQEKRGWNQGVGGLAFLGIMVGNLLAVGYTIWANKTYVKADEEHNGLAPPEARLPPALVGSIALPISLFWFAWTTSPSIHWMVSIAAGVPFGFGIVLVFLSTSNYLIDAYTIFAASVLAATSVIRSIFSAVFPMFTTRMYDNLGIHWASSVPAFLALACVPFLFLFYKYGPVIRARCKFAAQSAEFMKNLQEHENKEEGEKHEDGSGNAEQHENIGFNSGSTGNDGLTDSETLSRAESQESKNSNMPERRSYDGNPYNIDRVHTRSSFN